jgi:hypothetical protein
MIGRKPEVSLKWFGGVRWQQVSKSEVGWGESENQ